MKRSQPRFSRARSERRDRLVEVTRVARAVPGCDACRMLDVLRRRSARHWTLRHLQPVLLDALRDGQLARQQSVPCAWSVADRWHVPGGQP